MNAPVLVINCGSSSIKYALIDADPQAPRLAGLAERLGSSDARLKGKDSAGESFTQPLPNADHADALNAILQRLEGRVPGAVGHRIVHGGEHFTQAALIDDSVIEAIETTAALAPLHNPANLAGIAATRKVFPDLPQVAVFDTAFHQTLPPRAYRYALPEALYTEHGIRRYGFHGTSHAFVSQRAGELSGRGAGGWLTAHLGNGCSTAAVWNHQSLDTSMGLTPLEGLVMGTRSGDVDPGLHAHLHRQLGWSLDEIDDVLNKQSGLLGLSGLTNDMREVEEQAVAGHPAAKLALDVFCYRIAKSLAALSCALPKLDGVIFTGGIGENSPIVRREVLALLPHFGFSLDEASNEVTIRGKESKLDSAGHQGPEVWVIPTDEEGRIAMETRHCVETAE
ncbi:MULTISPECIES: acetate/propionate family kinase [Halomonadaceae]|jgi:acetate kinase|uniref:Acetate kinase n=1 Tax=Vreelandella piezotolerans TaxID=2609667 RepID=A0ABQ6XD12_9GAMM|nr:MULTISPECIES: acetate kinase [Halomonas]KAE8439892.1 acetate kinase [Halomonas piezotolerans]QJA23429.1 acetate kinase [Halomonas piezotolerans]BCB61375.1 acetate kinase [Halomonas sp. A020]|tara:strand:+ start:922 stop:2106 length:1185 start_codon:yes stop_codon:yes gene_type:complete